MQIEVRPARRRGSTNSIFDQPLTEDNVKIDDDGSMLVTIDASGINCTKSLYRYELSFPQNETRSLLKALTSIPADRATRRAAAGRRELIWPA